MWSKGISYFKTLTRGMSESESVVENPDPPVGEEEGELGENDFNELPGEGEGIETGETNEEFGVLPSNPVDEVQGPPVDPNKVLELGDRILIVQEGDKISVGTVYYRTGTLGPITVPVPKELLKLQQEKDKNKKTKKETKAPVKETQAQYINRRKEETARQKYPQLFKNYDQTTSDAGGNLYDPTDTDQMKRLEQLGLFENTD